MEILTINLAASETKSFRKAGSYIEILSSTGPVTISLYAPNAGICNTIQQGQSGLFLSVDFDAFDLQNQYGSAQTVQLMVCDQGEEGGSRRQPGNVRVIDEITDAIVSTNYLPLTSVAALSFTQIVAPSANIKGVIVRGVGLDSISAATGTANVGFVACKSAPVDLGIPVQRYTLGSCFSSGGVAQLVRDQHFNKLLPNGWGIYAYSSVGVAAAATVGGTIQYEVLT